MKKTILATLFLALFAFPASAGLIRVEMTGTVTSVEHPLGGEFSIGETITLLYDFDTTTSDTDPREEWGTYLGAIKAAFVLIGDYTLTVIGVGNILIRDGAFGEDLYGVLIEDVVFSSNRPGAILQGASVAGLNPFAIGVDLQDLDAEVYSSDTLPTSFPDLSLFEVKEFELAFAEEILLGRAVGTSRVYGSIDTITVVQLPIADAGEDQTVDEDDLVTLDGSQSTDDGDPLTSYVWAQVAGPPVMLDLSDPQHPTFLAPFVGVNTTLTFQLIVGDGTDFSDPDTVDIVVASVNELPVADAGNDSTIKEGATAQLDGSNSFDPESDPITFDWDQVPGTPVTLLPNDAVEKPTFVAPLVAGETLIFKLVVDDGFETSIPSPRADSRFADTVAVTVVPNSQPTADAGSNQTKEEGSVVSLNGSASSDPDLGDSLSFQWTQPGGTTVNLSSATSPTPKFDAPAVAPGGEALTFRLVVTDDDPVSPMSSTPDDVVINVTSINDPPRCDLAVASKDVLLPPNHKMEQISIEGVSDGDITYNVVTLEITGVTQDEPVSGLGSGDSSPDAVIQVGDPADTVLIRRERFKDGNGRVYEVAFTADDGFESCDGVVQVSVPRRRKLDAVDDGQIFDSTQP